MSLILKMQINDQSENKYIFSTENGEIELIPLSVIANGEYIPEEGQAFSKVTVAVPATVIEKLNITENGTYEASSGHAYDVVTVNVQPILDILVDTVNENGTYVYEPNEGYDGLEEVRVTVSVPEPVFESLTRTITANGTYNYKPSSGKDGFDEANITVNVPSSQPNLQTKQVTVTQNGSSVIIADTGYEGLEEVDLTVNVPSSGSIQVKQFYTPEDISDYLGYVDFDGVANKIIKGVFIFATNGLTALDSRIERYGIISGCCVKVDVGSPTYPHIATYTDGDKGMCSACYKSSSTDGSRNNVSGGYGGIYSQYSDNCIANGTNSFMKICPNNRVGFRVRKTTDTSGYGLMVGVDYTVVAWFD